jgi:hypothetical protein
MKFQNRPQRNICLRNVKNAQKKRRKNLECATITSPIDVIVISRAGNETPFLPVIGRQSLPKWRVIPSEV